jgi:hypothetical protein
VPVPLLIAGGLVAEMGLAGASRGDRGGTLSKNEAAALRRVLTEVYGEWGAARATGRSSRCATRPT